MKNLWKERKERKKAIQQAAYLENGKPDYDYYIMEKSETLFYTIVGMVLFALIAFTFYRSVVICAIFALAGSLYPEYMYHKVLEKRKQNLNLQFKELLYALSSSLNAGKSVETAFQEAKKDLSLLYPDENTDILREIEYILRGLSLNEPIETLLYDFGNRSHDEDILNFADIFASSKRTSGRIDQVVRITSNVISDKIETKREIQMGLSEKKVEQRAMNGLILLVVLGLTYGSGDYMDVMFTTIGGRIAMTIAFLLFLGSYLLGEKITNIEV